MQPILRVAAPARTFDVPPIENRIDVGVGDFATLLGFHVPSDTFAPGDTIDLTLFWQPRAETSTSYKVFVHVLDEAGRIVAQADAMPLNGERPTTGLLPHQIHPPKHTPATPPAPPAPRPPPPPPRRLPPLWITYGLRNFLGGGGGAGEGVKLAGVVF